MPRRKRPALTAIRATLTFPTIRRPESTRELLRRHLDDLQVLVVLMPHTAQGIVRATAALRALVASRPNDW
jgi:hypothetical protein